MSIRRKGRYWEVLDDDQTLVCLTVYRKGACEVVRRLQLPVNGLSPAVTVGPEQTDEPQ